MMVKKLIAMAVISFIAMYSLMYMMVDVYGNIFSNVNQLYMAGLMTGAMLLIEIAVMGSMYSKKTTLIVAIIGIAILAIGSAGIRTQFAVSDKEFLKSMIPHHASALLMCKKADLNDLEIRQLCNDIVAGQQNEIDWMKAKLMTVK